MTAFTSHPRQSTTRRSCTYNHAIDPALTGTIIGREGERSAPPSVTDTYLRVPGVGEYTVVWRLAISGAAVVHAFIQNAKVKLIVRCFNLRVTHLRIAPNELKVRRGGTLAKGKRRENGSIWREWIESSVNLPAPPLLS